MDPVLVHLLNALPEPSFLLDGEGAIRAANTAAARLCARSRQSLVGLNLGDFVAGPNDRTSAYLNLMTPRFSPSPSLSMN